MTPDNWIKLVSLAVDVIKTIIPFAFIFGIFFIFKNELRELIKKGGWKVSAPGVSIETVKQQEELGSKEKKKIDALNKELDTTKKAQEKLEQLLDYTARDKNTFFLGYHFEKTYRVIFPSQMAILIAIQNQGEIIDARSRALFTRTIWAQTLKITYEQFMAFLIGSGLIQEDKANSKFTLTPIGNLFLQYLTQNTIPNKLPATDIAVSS